MKEIQSGCYLSFPLVREVGIRNVYNLFSNFGNISFIKKTKRDVFVKFRSLEYAAMAQNYLQGYELMGNTLSLTTLPEIANALPKEDEYAEITYYDSSFDRYRPPYSASPPSSPSPSTLPARPCMCLRCAGKSAGRKSCGTSSRSSAPSREWRS